MKSQSPQGQLYTLLRGNFSAFVQKVFQEVDPGKTFIDNWSIDAITYRLERCRTGRCKRLIINQPPRSGKSLAASVAFPAFVLGHDPSKRILCISYANNLALKHARDFQNVVESPWYHQCFPKVIAARNVEDNFETRQRGVRASSSFSSSNTGFGYDMIIIDDPIKVDEASTKSQRDKANDYFASTLYTRLNHKSEGVIILAMQRVHDEDLVGYLLRQGGWDHLKLPAIAEQDEDIPIGDGQFYHRIKREVLNPALESLSSLEDTKRVIGTPNFQTQYQQAPIPESGNLIKKEWLKYFQLPPSRANGRVVQSWDTATKGNQVNDYSVGTTWLYVNEKHYLIDLVRQQCDFPTLFDLVRNQYAKHMPDALLIEDHGSGSALIQDLNHHNNIMAIPIIPSGDKVMRLLIVSPRFEAGEIYFPKEEPWLMELLDELLRFPQTKFDDQVDSITQYLNWHRGRGKTVFEVFWT